jgi:hypothetical protein
MSATRLLGLLVLASSAVPACGADGSDAQSALVASPPDPKRPEVVFAAGGGTLDIPDEVPAGFVDVRIRALPDGPAHLLIARLDGGVTYEEFEAAPPDASGLELVTVTGGNGTIDPGQETVLTMDLAPGDYSVVNIHGLPPRFAYDRLRVVDQGNEAGAPDDEGTVTLGPGMQIGVPDDFDATGRWRFENPDTVQTHEAALARLADGHTADDVVEWFRRPEGPPPIVGEFGGMGALGPGQEAWIDLDAPTPGEYVLICFVPGDDGLPHAGAGMVAPVTVATP